jgi:hypothetical protein
MERWGVWWQAKTSDEGHLVCENCIPVLFETKREAKEYIDKKFDYIRHRKDLRIAPHYWRSSKPVRVIIQRKEGE